MGCSCRVALMNDYKRDVAASLESMEKWIDDMMEEVESSKATPDTINSDYLLSKVKKLKETRDCLIALGKSLKGDDAGGPPKKRHRCVTELTFGAQLEIPLGRIRSKLLSLTMLYDCCVRSQEDNSWMETKTITADLFAGHSSLVQTTVGVLKSTLFGPNFMDDALNGSEGDESNNADTGSQDDEADEESDDDDSGDDGEEVVRANKNVGESSRGGQASLEVTPGADLLVMFSFVRQRCFMITEDPVGKKE